jgi:very-short-patch-repair endonuclease
LAAAAKEKVDWEEKLYAALREAGLPEPQRQYRFHPKRRWVCDFAWPDYGLLVEVEGGVWLGHGRKGSTGRHNHPAGFSKDCEKYNAAELLRWTLLRFTTTQVHRGVALRVLDRFFESWPDTVILDFAYQ